MDWSLEVAGLTLLEAVLVVVLVPVAFVLAGSVRLGLVSALGADLGLLADLATDGGVWGLEATLVVAFGGGTAVVAGGDPGLPFFVATGLAMLLALGLPTAAVEGR